MAARRSALKKVPTVQKSALWEKLWAIDKIDQGDELWRVRLGLKGGGLIHLLSRTEPIVKGDSENVQSVEADWIIDTPYGDKLLRIDWSSVSSVAVRQEGDSE